MKHPHIQDTPMWEDPNESPFIRELLQAGRRSDTGYDVDRGLARHLAMISGSGATQAAAAAAAVKGGIPTWLGVIAAPLVAAGVAGLLWVFSGSRSSDSRVSTPGSRELAPAAVADNAAADGLMPPLAAAPEPFVHDAIPERRTSRSGARPHPTLRAWSRGSRAPSEPPSIGAIDTEDSPASALPDPRDRPTSADGSGAANPYRNTGDDDQSEAANRATSPAADHDHDHDHDHDVASRRDETIARDERQGQVREERVVEAEEPEPEPEAVAAPPPPAERGKGAANAPAPLPVIDESRLEREMQMLAVTQRVLASDPARALRLSQQGEREFAGSMLSAERRQLGLLALVKLGRLDEARRAGRPFLARYPKAPWSERLHHALVTGKVE